MKQKSLLIEERYVCFDCFSGVQSSNMTLFTICNVSDCVNRFKLKLCLNYCIKAAVTVAYTFVTVPPGKPYLQSHLVSHTYISVFLVKTV